MANQLYEEMNPMNNNFMAQFQQFASNFRGNPQQQIQQLLNSGRITQQQYNMAVQKAQMIQRMFGIK